MTRPLLPVPRAWRADHERALAAIARSRGAERRAAGVALSVEGRWGGSALAELGWDVPPNLDNVPHVIVAPVPQGPLTRPARAGFGASRAGRIPGAGLWQEYLTIGAQLLATDDMDVAMPEVPAPVIRLLIRLRGDAVVRSLGLLIPVWAVKLWHDTAWTEDPEAVARLPSLFDAPPDQREAVGAALAVSGAAFAAALRGAFP